MGSQRYKGAVLAGRRSRYAAGFIDHGISPTIIFGSAILNFVLDLADVEAPTVSWLLQVTFALGLPLWPLWLIGNSIILQGKTGQSIGKRWCKLRLVDGLHGRPPGYWVNLARFLLHGLDNASAYVGWLLPLGTDKRQTLADMLCNTVVVRHDPSLTEIDSSWRYKRRAPIFRNEGIARI